MKPLIFFLFFFTPVILFAQSNHQYWEWAKSFGGSGNDITADIKIKDGYLYVTGTFTSPTIIWESTTLFNHGGRDIFVAKLDTNGNTIWAKNFGGTGDDTVRQLEINNSAVFVLLGKSESSSINFGTEILDTAKNFYSKFDSDGNLLKAQTLPDSLTYDDIDIDNDGSVYVASRYNTIFTFANTTVSLTPPVTPPAGAPFIYLDNSGNPYYYPYPGQAPYYTEGAAALLKYDVTGNEAWIKVFHARPYALLIQYNNSDNSMTTLFDHYGQIDLDSVYYGGTGTDELNSLFIAGISPQATIKYANNFIRGGGRHGQVSYSDFSIGNSGSGFIGYSYSLGQTNFAALLSKFSNGHLGQTISSYSGPFEPGTFHYNFNTMESIEDNQILLNSYSISNSDIFVLDTNLIVKDSLSIPGGEKLTLNKKAGINKAVYFGDYFSADSLHIENTSTIPAQVVNLYNQGSNDIFIGKYHRQGYMPLAFNAFKDTFKFCYGNSSITLDSAAILRNSGAGQLSYHWSPAANFENPNSLNTRIIMTSDTIIARLTVTDATGDSISKIIIFFNGIQPDIHLKLLDTAVCRSNFIKLTLEGNQFISCYAQGSCDQQFTVTFDSLHQVKQLYSGSCPGANYYQLKSDAPGYCLDTTSLKLIIYPYYSLYNSVHLCSGSSYTIPGDTTYANITSTTRRVLSLQTAHGCDSITVTDLFVISPANRTETITVCAGSNYTFPDNTTATNILTNMDHMSPLKAIGGCDSIYLQTIINVLPVYSQTNNVNVCSGASFTFPDNSVLNNIQTGVSHTSHFTGYNGCDSNIITHLTVYPNYTRSQNIDICSGSNYSFPDGFTQTGITSNISHTSHLNSVNGCDSIITTNITASPLYNNTENVSICAGNNYTFPDGTIINNIESDVTHQNQLISISGCDSIITTNLHVNTLDTSVTKTRAALQANLNNGGYQWFDCTTNTILAGETGQTYTATLVGSYAVKLLKDGCIDTSSCYTIAFDDLLRLNGSHVNIYPVPASNFLMVEFIANRPAVLQSRIIDLRGQVVLSNQKNLVAGINQISFNITGLQRGLYTITLFNTTTQEKVIKKVIIN